MEIKKAWTLLPESLQKILKRHHAFLAGGSILAGIIDGEINDYDLWFPDGSKLTNCFNDLVAEGADIEYNSENAWTLKLWKDFKIQCVKKHIGSPQMILRGFDFKFCQFGIDCRTEEVVQRNWSPEKVLKKSKLASPLSLNNRAHHIVARGGIPKLSDFFMTWLLESSELAGLNEEDDDELEEVVNPEYDDELDTQRILKYFEKNLIHISADSMIQMFFDSNLKIPGWLMARSKRLWLMDGWTKDHLGNLHPPTKNKTHNTYY